MPRPRIRRGYSLFAGSYNPWKTVIIVAITVVAVIVLGFLTVSSYRPILDYFSPSSSTESAESIVSRAPAVSAPSSSGVEETPFSAVEPSELRAAYMPLDVSTNENLAYTYLNSLARSGYNAVVLECKNSDGRICYQSRDTFVVRNELMREEGVSDLPTLTETAHSLGLTVYASVCAFQDHLAGKYDLSMAITLADQPSVYGLDDELENGGKSWLNPCSQTAQDYICRIVDEVTLYGVDGVILESAVFPTVPGSELAGYGSDVTSDQYADRLAEFVNRCRLAAKANGSVLCFSVSASAALELDMTAYGGKNPLTFGEAYAMVALSPEQFSELIDGERTVSDPAADPAASILLLADRLNSANENGTVLLARMNYYLLRDDLPIGEFLTAQTEAAEQTGFGLYYYEPNGKYVSE